MRFSVLSTLLIAMPLMAIASPNGIVPKSEILAARQGSDNGCYTWSYCDYQNDCFNLCKCNQPPGAPCTNPHPTDPTHPH